MSGVAKEYAELYTAHTECPAESFYISYLTCLGATLSRTLTIDSLIATQPRLYVLILGRSSDDRKSTAIKHTVSMFKGLVEVCKGVGSAEGLVRKLNDVKRLILFFDEFKQFVSKCSIQSSTLLECVNSLFEDNDYSSLIKDRDNGVDEAWLTFISASTIQTYERAWSSSFTDIGFNNRLFIVPATGKKKYNWPPPIPPEKQRYIIRLTNEIIRFVGDGMKIGITDEADKVHYKWYMIPDRGIHHTRLEGYSLRFMQLLAVNEQKDIIDVDIVEKAITLMDWQLNVRQLYSPIDADNEMAKMEGNILKQLDKRGMMSNRELYQYTHADRKGTWIFNTAKNNLEKNKDIEYDKINKTWNLIESDVAKNVAITRKYGK